MRGPLSAAAARAASSLARIAGVAAVTGALVVHAADGVAPPPAAAAADCGVFFDDFHYTEVADLEGGGWERRSGTGHPGLPGGRFDAQAVTLVDDPALPGNRLLRLTARTDGSAADTVQAQVCQQRKYLDGTYAARIRFSDAPRAGEGGDFVVQSFYAVAPLAHAFDPDFSEIDWEYLPNGGWGSDKRRLYDVSWQTVRIDPWEAHNSAHESFGSFDGWHVLLMQVGHGTVREFVDGEPVAVHQGRNVPVVPMAIAFNLWFAQGGPLPVGGAPRVYDEDVDWVFHARDATLAPAEVDQRVRAWRAAHIWRVDTVPPADPPLPARCDF